jgi:hypothetical protein
MLSIYPPMRVLKGSLSDMEERTRWVILAGVLKGIYDLGLLAAFRNVKPKEET